MTVRELREKLQQMEDRNQGHLTVVCIAPEWEQQTEMILESNLPLSFPWDVHDVDYDSSDEVNNCYLHLSGPEVM